MDAYFLGVVSFMALLFLSSLIYIGSRKIHFPYTIALVGSGILMGALVYYVPALSFLTTFELTQQTLLYVFLPVLLFESAYNIKFREMMQHTRAIALLAVVALLISAVISSILLYYVLGWFGVTVPFLVLFAFGTLISATDPVSVLALFKEMGAPRRLTLIFEGESLFNDGTALALFLVLLSILIPSTSEHTNLFNHLIAPLLPMGESGIIIGGFISFLLMIIMGFFVGGVIGYITSRSISFMKKSKLLEITLTVILAHTTFLLAEWINHAIIPVSAVITTTIAALVMGNYGRYKLSPDTRHMMGEYWEFFAFIANSMVFLLVGIMIVELNINFLELIIPIFVAIIAVMIARAISIYSVLIPLNSLKKEFKIATSWMHLLSWGSLRGGLAIVMALFIPADFTLSGWTLSMSVRDFVIGITVGCIVFTTFVKATTIPYLLKKLKITSWSLIENMDYQQGRIIFLVKLLGKIDSIAERGFITQKQREKIEKFYHDELKLAEEELEKIAEQNPKEAEIILERTLALHALEIEEYILIHLFNHQELPEGALRRMMNKLESQIERIEAGKTQIKEAYEHKLSLDIFTRMVEKIVNFFSEKFDPEKEKYIKARTRSVILEKVLKRFEIFHTVPQIADSDALRHIEELYKTLLENANNTRETLYKKSKIKELEHQIVQKMLHIRKDDIIHYLTSSNIISYKTGKALRNEYISE